MPTYHALHIYGAHPSVMLQNNNNCHGSNAATAADFLCFSQLIRCSNHRHPWRGGHTKGRYQRGITSSGLRCIRNILSLLTTSFLHDKNTGKPPLAPRGVRQDKGAFVCARIATRQPALVANRLRPQQLNPQRVRSQNHVNWLAIDQPIVRYSRSKSDGWRVAQWQLFGHTVRLHP